MTDKQSEVTEPGTPADPHAHFDATLADGRAALGVAVPDWVHPPREFVRRLLGLRNAPPEALAAERILAQTRNVVGRVHGMRDYPRRLEAVRRSQGLIRQRAGAILWRLQLRRQRLALIMVWLRIWRPLLVLVALGLAVYLFISSLDLLLAGFDWLRQWVNDWLSGQGGLVP